jgi:predicted transcriptional regulator
VVHKTKYIFSFTGASAMISETLVIAEEFNRLKDWKAVEKSLFDNNLLNKVKQATFKREFSEIKKRLSLLTFDQLDIMIHGSLDDAKSMILLSLVKAYTFLKEFIIDVIRNKYLLFDTVVSEIDYIKFFNTKSLTHNELNEITELTAKKVKQVIFKILEQVGLITQAKNGSILKPILNSKIVDVIVDDDPALLNAFLFSNEEIKTLLQKLKHA